MAKKPEPINEKTVDTKAIPALREWIKESGILGVLKKHGIKKYLFLLVGGCGFGYATKGCDTDLLLIYNGYEPKYALKEYERMHGILHDWYFAQIGRTEEEGERVRKSLEKKEIAVRSLLCKEKELVGFVPLAIELCNTLKMSRIPDEYGNLALYYPTSNPLDPELPEPALRVNETLKETGLHFGEVFLRPLHHYKDVTLRRGIFKTASSDKSELWENRVDEELAETLFLLNGELSLDWARLPVKVVFAPDKNVQENFIRFLVSLINIDFSCKFAERYAGLRYFENYVKRWAVTKDPKMRPYAQLFKKALALKKEARAEKEYKNWSGEKPENELFFKKMKLKK